MIIQPMSVSALCARSQGDLSKPESMLTGCLQPSGKNRHPPTIAVEYVIINGSKWD